MKKKTIKYNDDHRELFKDVVFLVEASYNEKFMLWKMHHWHRIIDMPRVKEWKDEGMGRIITLGLVDKRPTCVDIYYASLNGKRIMFYNGSSELVDHKMIEDWLKHFTLDSIRWDNNSRWAHCDASGFHLCLDAIGVLDDYRNLTLDERQRCKAV